MQVIHVSSGRLFGGVEQMLVTLARWRAATPDVHVRFAVAAPGRLEEELRGCGVEVDLLGDVRLSRPASVVQARSRLARVLRSASKQEPVVLVCHAPWSFALFAPVAAKHGVPRVLWQHDHASGRSIVERWGRSTPANLVICNSVWTSKTAGALQPGVAVAVIHPPVAVPDVSEETVKDDRARLRAEIGAASTDVVILSASRLEPWKGHMNVLGGLALLRNLGAWTLWVAGGAQRPHERKYAAELEAEAARSGLSSRVTFLGERRDVPSLMRAADLFCQVNDGPEPFGVVFAEALLSGLPVVSANVGGAPEIVSETCGRLVPANDRRALAGALEPLILDMTLRSRLGANGPAHANARVAPAVVLPQIARALGALTASAAA